jgi:septal ring factor EnvC (AmiA/AmiB activator)
MTVADHRPRSHYGHSAHSRRNGAPGCALRLTKSDTSPPGSLHFNLPSLRVHAHEGAGDCSVCSAAAHGSIVISSRRWAQLARTALVTAAVVTIVAPVPSGAQENDEPGRDDQARPGDGGQIALDLDVLRVEVVQVEDALGSVADNVAAQQTALDAAHVGLMQAQAALNDANAAVEAAQAQLDGLAALTDIVVIEAYMNPPVESGIEALSAESMTDASIKQSILNEEASSDAALLDQFEAARRQLERDRAAREDAAAAAADRQSDAEAALANLNSALSQQARFVLEVERRLDQRLSEAQALADLDPELAAQILAREAQLAGVVRQVQEEAQREHAQELAEQMAQQAAQAAASGIQDPPGGLATASCPGGGSITVAGDIQGAVQRLVDDAAADGVTMCGNGYRDPQDQINLRRQHCGSSNYAIYQAPSSSCSPPTAKPGSSLHEQGLAIDFTCGGGGTVSYGDPCYDWLQAHSEEYGLYNLPSESWHYSVNGD